MAALSSEAVRQRPTRALVIEDDSPLRDEIASFLRDAGYVVDEAPDGEAGLQRLRDGSPIDVLLLDLMLPRLDGWSLLKILRASAGFAKLPVLVLSAYYDPTRELGQVRFMPKPFKIERVLRALDDLMAPARARNDEEAPG
jgi:DNA-binding response OmpR family regulator